MAKDIDIERVIEEKYSDYIGQIISMINGLKDCRQSGDDSPLKNVWQEWAHQLQYEHTALFFAYEETLRSFCQSIVSKLPTHEQRLLWLWMDPSYTSLDENTSIPDITIVAADLQEELYLRVCEAASDEELPDYPYSNGS